MALHYQPRKPRSEQIAELEEEWRTNPRWSDVKRGYSAEDVVQLRGTIPHRSMLAAHGADKLWDLLQSEDFVNCLGALTGGQAVHQSHLPVRVASRRRCEYIRDDVPRSIALRREFGSNRRQSH